MIGQNTIITDSKIDDDAEIKSSVIIRAAAVRSEHQIGKAVCVYETREAM